MITTAQPGTKRCGPRALICPALVVLSVAVAHASFDTDLETIARNMAAELDLSPTARVSMTTLEQDRNYMLSLAPIYKKLREKLHPYAKNVSFNSFRGQEHAAIRTMILTGNAEYAPMQMPEWSVDSLILSGWYYLLEGESDKINYKFKVCDRTGRLLFESDEYRITKSDCPPALQRRVFSRLRDEESFGEVEFRGHLIQKLDKLFNSPNNNLLAHPQEYRFENRYPYALQWQIAIIKETLSLKYGISLVEHSDNVIRVLPTGELEFSRQGRRRSVHDLVDAEDMLPDSFPAEQNQYRYFNTSMPDAPVEVKKISTPAERTIRDLIHETFNVHYPRLFTNFNYAKLDEIYAHKDHPSILVGNVRAVKPRIGREVVEYSWRTKEQWLTHLKKLHDQKGRRFDVDTDVMGIFQDNLAERRYWAVVRQKWKTKDRYGKVVYQDDGFLFVNFDFDADMKLREFEIHYRLWFYNYQYDDIELGLKRHEKLTNDINNHFVRAMGGIDARLKVAIRDFLKSKINDIDFR